MSAGDTVKTRMRYCVNCAAMLTPGGRYCPTCGADADAPPPATFVPPPPLAIPRPAPAIAQPRKTPMVVILVPAMALGAAVLLVSCVLIAAFTANKGEAGPLLGADPTPPSKSAARVVDPRLLSANPSSYKGANIIVQGEALNVEQHSGYTWVQVLARIPGKDYDTEAVVVELYPAASGLLKGECYAFYGVGAGTQKVTRTLTGATNEVPMLRGYTYYTSTADKYGTCGAPAP